MSDRTQKKIAWILGIVAAIMAVATVWLSREVNRPATFTMRPLTEDDYGVNLQESDISSYVTVTDTYTHKGEESDYLAAVHVLDESAVVMYDVLATGVDTETPGEYEIVYILLIDRAIYEKDHGSAPERAAGAEDILVADVHKAVYVEE